jgi:tetratricopeptide (TPR) repeat protein
VTESTITAQPVSLSSLFDRVEALFKQAELAISKEQSDLAEYFFQAAHSKDPENLELVIQEAKIWHRYGKLLENSKFFHKGYRNFKACFYSPQFSKEAYREAIELKLNEYLSTGNVSALYNGLKLIYRLQRQKGLNQDLEFIKAKFYFQKGLYYTDTCLLKKALNIGLDLFKVHKLSEHADFIATTYSHLHDITQDLSLMIQTLSYRKQSIDLDTDNLEILSSLAHDYKKIFYATSDETNIEHFHDTYQMATILKEDDTNLYLSWAEGLIDMGIHADNIDWVKLGIEKSHEALTRTSSSLVIDLLVARGFCYLGTKLDRLSHIQDAFDKIKHLDEELTNQRLLLTYVEILIAFGLYFQDIDYHYQAIEKLQEALSLDNSCRHLWIKMAKTYLDITQLDHNIETAKLSFHMINKAVAFYRCPETLILKASILNRLGELKGESEYFEEALVHFEDAFNLHQGFFQPRLNALFQYAKALDYCGNYHEDETYYLKALEQLTHIILIDPLYKELHHQIALTQFHLAELTMDPEILKKSLIHFKLATKNTDNDGIYVDWAVAFLTLSEMVDASHESLFLKHEASGKLKKALRLGQTQAYYFMGCLSSLCDENEKAMMFLKMAERHDSLPPPEDIAQDEWLSSLKHDHEFIKLLDRQEVKRA